jgi:acyl carrier protein
MSGRIETLRDLIARHGKMPTDVRGPGINRSLYDAGLTSHASVNVLLAIEDEYDFEFPERLAKRATFESIGNLSAALNSVLGPEP